MYLLLGATPDGVVGDDLIVEIKCPYSAYRMTVEDAVRQKKINFWKYKQSTASYEINTNSAWYFQIQGQLKVTKRKACIFAVWTGPQNKMKVEYVVRRPDFWKNRMEEKLKNFYFKHLLPELVDPRHVRGMPIREPE